VGFFMAAVDEKLDLESLADQSSLHVDHADQHGIDFAEAAARLSASKLRRGSVITSVLREKFGPV